MQDHLQQQPIVDQQQLNPTQVLSVSANGDTQGTKALSPDKTDSALIHGMRTPKKHDLNGSSFVEAGNVFAFKSPAPSHIKRR